MLNSAVRAPGMWRAYNDSFMRQRLYSAYRIGLAVHLNMHLADIKLLIETFNKG